MKSCPGPFQAFPKDDKHCFLWSEGRSLQASLPSCPRVRCLHDSESETLASSVPKSQELWKLAADCQMLMDAQGKHPAAWTCSSRCDLKKKPLSTRIQDAGIVTRHSRGYIISIMQTPSFPTRFTQSHPNPPSLTQICSVSIRFLQSHTNLLSLMRFHPDPPRSTRSHSDLL